MTDWKHGLHPDLIPKVERVLFLMAQVKSPMFVVQGLRTLEQQQAAWEKGRTVKGPKVTNADGIIHKSNHQAQDDGYGHAVDCAFVGDLPFAENHPWSLYGDLAKDAGLKWGGDWKSFTDRPHIEL